jgi:ABC-type multidrug transport system fused ATPase/permease subunit
LVDLMLGLLHPQKGQLLVDGKHVNRENCAMWQKNIGYVPQNIYLTDDTVEANIAFGVPNEKIIQADVVRAAQVANLHDFVCLDLPLGYKTQVGERGVRLSGGQRQRIGIARALYNNPQVLILDEATSALDNWTERLVMEAVENLSRKITLIIVAHRLSTVRDCDTIFLIERGRLVGQGSFDDLVSQNEKFRLMVNASSD